MIKKDQLIEAGKILKPHGYKGELNAICDYPAEILSDNEIPVVFYLDGIATPFFPAAVRSKGEEGLLVRFDGIDSDKQARELVNHPFYLLRRDVANFCGVEEDEIEDNEDSDDRFSGYKVIDVNHGAIGTAGEFIPGVEYDYLAVSTPGGHEIMIPWIDEMVESWDDEQQILDVSLPAGLLDTFAPGEFQDSAETED